MAQESDNSFEELTELARTSREKFYTEQFIAGERLREWLLRSPEGRLIADIIKDDYLSALAALEECALGDVQALTEAQLRLEVCKRVRGCFEKAFQAQQEAEQQLTEE